MISYIRRCLNPDWYHGHHQKGPFFEGWYIKIVDREELYKFAFIIGVFIHPDEGKSHAFIQTLNGNTLESTYHTYPLEAFFAADNELDVCIGNTHLRRDCLSLNIIDGDTTIRGHLTFHDLSKLPKSWFSPGAMGPGSWITLECNHGIVSLDHRIQGILEVNGKLIDFGEGRGYMEKDWGTRFPSGYVWQQSNHFSQPRTSLTYALGCVPVLGVPIIGFGVTLLHQGHIYTFALYNLSRIEVFEITKSHVYTVLKRGSYVLEIKTERHCGGLLIGPQLGSMSLPVNETIDTIMDVRLTKKKRHGKEIIFADRGYHAGLEINGNLERLA